MTRSIAPLGERWRMSGVRFAPFSSVKLIPNRFAFSVSIWSVVSAAALSFASTKLNSYFIVK